MTPPGEGGASRLPSLGHRGEGWVVGQGVLLALVAVLGMPGLATLPPSDPGRWATVVLGLALMVGGCLVGIAGARELGRSLTAVPRPKPGAQLVDSGIFGMLRHPLYLALISAAIGWSVAMASPASLVAAVALAVWLDAKSRREEAWLLEAYEGYATYRRRTARFVPRVY